MLNTLLDSIAQHPEGIETDRICHALGKSPQELGDTFERLLDSGEVVGFAGLWLTTPSWQACRQRIIDALGELHERQPQSPFFSSDDVQERAKLPWPAKPWQRAITNLAEAGVLEDREGWIRLRESRLELSDRKRQLVDRVTAELERSGHSTPTPRQLAEALGVPIQAIDEIMGLASLSGDVVLLAEGVSYTHSQLEALQAALRKSASGAMFTTRQAKEWLGVSRRHTVALLERWDEEGVTRRVDGKRIFVT